LKSPFEESRVINRTDPQRMIFCVSCVLALLSATACEDKNKNKGNGEHHAPGVWLVHATDPHIFLPAATESTDKDKKAEAIKQQEGNEKALSDMLKRSGSVPDGGGPPAFLVLTGDLGIDPCPIRTGAGAPAAKETQTAKTGTAKVTATATKKTAAETPGAGSGNACVTNVDKVEQQKQIDKLAGLLGASPLKDIYLVAGNNDIANEDPQDDALTYFNDMVDKIQDGIKSNVRLHNLTRCYSAKSGDPSGCVADVVGTSYRLIGFPSYSFKNKTPKPGDLKTQEKQFDIFHGLLDQARQAGKKVLVLSHVPEIDDPYTLAQDRFNGVQPAKANDPDDKVRSRWSTWNVSKKLLDDWYSAVASDSVKAVLAGHLHDSHKEAYRPPYSWSTPTGQRGGFQKLLLAPPLAIKNQDGSPIQARGFSLVHLESDSVRPRLYWYSSETGDFKAEPSRNFEEAKHQRQWYLPRFFVWAWGLDSNDSALIRLAALLIALLTAYLTVVAIWQIPAAENLLADSTIKTDKDKKETQSAADNSPFATRFGKTVLAGLGGLAMTEVAKTLGSDKTSPDSRWFYIVWFILFFFLLLLVLNFLRALAEAVRTRIAVVYYPLPRTSPFAYWFLGFFRWLVSLRVPFLTMSDSFLNLIQGKNQTMTRALAEKVVDQQRSIVRLADAIRQDLNDLIDQRVRALRAAGSHHVRVNISVLSADQSKVFYISHTPGSSRDSFTKRSVAWVAVFTGSIRWYLDSYLNRTDNKQVVLFDNKAKVIADDDELIMLKTHYQARPGADYQAFVILPVPWPQRGFGTDYVKGAIHISFFNLEEFAAIWKDTKGLEPIEKDANKDHLYYPDSGPILEGGCDPLVNGALHVSLKALGELLYGFNEEIYRNYIEPTQPH
jgi:hypothetical protein